MRPLGLHESLIGRVIRGC